MQKDRDTVNFRMQLTRAKKIALASLIIVLLLSGLLLARYFSIDSSASEREQLLQLIPAGASAVIYLDADELRASSLLAKFYAWSALGSPDSEYSQFVQDTGFSYERDLKRIAIAISNQGATSNVFAVADGKFDRKRIESFLRRNGKSSQQGRWTVFQLNTLSNERQMSLTFLPDSRIAIFDSGNSSAPLASTAKDPGRAEWSERFERLAGTPFFVVIRQDSAVQDALNAAPGGLRSPQLSALLSQLQWFSISGKPDGDQLRVVAEGESPSPATVSQLSELA